MITARFSEYKQKITEAVQAKLTASPINGENGFTLVDGIIMQQLNPEISSNITIGGQTQFVPLVAIVGNTSGRIYFFALKALNISGLEI